MVICTDEATYTCCEINNVPVMYAYCNEDFFARQLRKYSLNRNSLEKKIFNKELIDLNDSWILVTDPCISVSFLEWLSMKNPGKKLSFYYLNPVRLSVNPKKIPSEYRIVTYSKSDAKKYNLEYVGPFFLGKYEPEIKSKFIYDVIFVGRDHKRMHDVHNLVNIITELGFDAYEYYTPDRWWMLYFNKRYNKGLSFTGYLELMDKAKCVIDYYPKSEEDRGLTQRPLEALFYQKKVITNNKKILDEKCYIKENYFIIGLDDCKYLSDFIKDPYVVKENRFNNIYKIDYWIKRNDFN